MGIECTGQLCYG